METKFNSYFNMMIALTMKSVLAMVNDFSWQTTSDRNTMAFTRLYETESNLELCGMRKLYLIKYTHDLLKPQVGAIQIQDLSDILNQLTANGEIAITETTDGNVYHLKITEIKDYINVK